MGNKFIHLISGSEKDFETSEWWQWWIYCEICQNGSFHHKGAIGTQLDYSKRHRRSRLDRQWFRRWLGDNYVQQFVIHYNKEGFCFLILEAEHKIIHGAKL